MKRILVYIIILLTSTICSGQQQQQFKDTSKTFYIVDTFKVEAGILVAKDGTGFVPFRSITVDQLKYVFELIAYFEQGNKLKQQLEKK